MPISNLPVSHMWWDEFEKQLQWAYSTINKAEGRVMHSEEQKLRRLRLQVKAPFLGPLMSTIVVAMTNQIPGAPVYTFDSALMHFESVFMNNSLRQESKPHLTPGAISDKQRLGHTVVGVVVDVDVDEAMAGFKAVGVVEAVVVVEAMKSLHITTRKTKCLQLAMGAQKRNCLTENGSSIMRRSSIRCNCIIYSRTN